MENRNPTQSKTSALHHKAEAFLKEQHEKANLTSTEADMLKLIHELKVHQIELEQQNEELIRGRSGAQEAIDFYDFAPTAYFTLSQAGEIIRLNPCGAEMLGKDHGLLENSLFDFFVSDESKPTFNLFLEKVFKSKTTETCEVVLLGNKNHPVYVQLKGLITQNQETCLIASVDITEQKQTEIQLRIREERYRLLAENSRDVIWTMKLDGTITYISPAVEQLRGFTVEEAMKQPLDMILTPDSQAIVIEYLQRLNAAFTSGMPLESFRGENEYYCKDGSTLWTEVIVHPLRAIDTGSVTLLGVTRDNTERRKAESALRESEEKHRVLFENSPDAYLTILNGKYNDCNKAAENLLCGARDQIIGRSPDALSPEMQPNGELSEKAAANRMAQAIESGFILFEWVHRRFDGSDFWAEISIGVIQIDGQPALFTAMRDITKRKKIEEALRESEEKFRTIAETSPLAIYMSTGIEQKAEYVNQTFVKKFGYTMEDVPTVKEWWPLAYPDEEYRHQVAAEWQKRISIAVENHSEIEPMDTVVTCKDGSLKNIQWGYKTIRKQNWAFGLDLTERIHAEMENQKTKKLLEDSQNAGRIGGWEFDIDTLELKWTKEMYNIHEVDLSYKPNVDQRDNFYTPESIPVVNNAVNRAIEYGEPYEIDSEIITAKGNRRSVKAIGKPDLENRRIFGLFHDITERKLAEQVLHETNAYLENLINYANGPIIVWDPQLRITRFNHAFEFITGRTEAEVLGKSLEILFPPAFAENSMNQIRKTQTGERWETVEIEIQHRDKSARTLLWNSATLFMPDGKTPIATIAQGQDITERKQMEEKLIASSTRLVLATRAGGVGIWDYDIVNNILEWDDQMFSLYGITKSQFGGAYEAWLTGVHPESKAQSEAKIQLALNGEKEFDTEFKVLWPDGSVHDIRALAIVLRSSTGKPLRMIGTNWDITLQKKAEAEIKHRSEELHELNATKDKFFSIIAHDLKSPFNSILGFSEMLKNEARDLDINSIEQYAGIINSSAQHTFELLINLLDWARMQQGKIPFEPKPVLFNDIVNSEFERLKETAGKKNISLIDENQRNIILKADENMLCSVIRNLISNAIKFTPKQGFVKVSAEFRDDYVHILVSDSGIGINPEIIGKLFKIETSFTTRGTENEKGTGLGLLLCKEFIEKHGGKIWVESEEGKGSTFGFSLPADEK
jgi:PAS domain S-box-containing protein